MTDQPTITKSPPPVAELQDRILELEAEVESLKAKIEDPSPPPLTQTEQCEIDVAMAGMQQLARDFLPHATMTFDRQEFRWEDMATEILVVNLTGASRQERHALSTKLVGFIVDSGSQVVKERMTFQIR